MILEEDNELYTADEHREEALILDIEGLLSPARESDVGGQSVMDIHNTVSKRIHRWRLGHTEFYRHLERASALVVSDPDASLNKCRKILEKMTYKLYKKHLGDPGTRPLEHLMTSLRKEGVMPRKIFALGIVVKELGNVGSHPIYDEEEITHRDAQISLLTILNILEWYVRYEALQEDEREGS